VATEIVLDINSEEILCNNFDNILKIIKDQDIIKIIGINEQHSYTSVKLIVKAVISYLNNTNILIIDISKVKYLNIDETAKLIGFPEADRKKIILKVIAHPQLHKKIMRFGIDTSNIISSC